MNDVRRAGAHDDGVFNECKISDQESDDDIASINSKDNGDDADWSVKCIHHGGRAPVNPHTGLQLVNPALKKIFLRAPHMGVDGGVQYTIYENTHTYWMTYEEYLAYGGVPPSTPIRGAIPYKRGLRGNPPCRVHIKFID